MTETSPFCRPDTVYCGDALRLLQGVPGGSIDLIITDPPFAIDFTARRGNYNRNGDRVIEGYRDIPSAEYAEFTHAWIGEAHRVLRDSGSMYIFSGWNNLKDILVAVDDVGFSTINHLIWKYQFGVFTRRKYVTSHYHILFVVKDRRRYTFNKVEHYPEDVWVINREYWTGKVKTPTKLPSKLVSKILSFSSNPGDLVLDPFLGSGTVAVAAKEMGRRYLGFEIVPEYAAFAEERLGTIAAGSGNDLQSGDPQ
jgi:site-specific DNA-methyltransferase (adenine-specific)